MTRRFGPIAAIGAALAATAVVGGAPGLARAAVAQPVSTLISPEEYTARMLTRIATMDLRFIKAEDIGPRDYQIAAILLGIAEGVTPDDEGIVRRRYEAAFSGGQTELAVELSRKLARLDPRDEVSLLLVISARIGRLQTVQERLDLYDRLLGPQGASLPAPVRSRLALDSALLLRERGDVEAFAERLAESVGLDSTHKEAAALAATYYADQMSDPAGRFELLSNLLYADPLDPNIHESLARLLMEAGSWEQARRFHENGIALVTGAGSPLTDQLYLEQQFIAWRLQGPQAVAETLNRLLEDARKQGGQRILSEYDKARRDAAARGQPSPPPPQIDLSKVTLPLPYERIRLMAAAAAGDAGTAEQAASNLELIFSSMAEQAQKEATDPAAADRQALTFMLDLQSMRLWAGVQIEKAAEYAASAPPLPDPTPEDEAALLFVKGLLALRTGDAAGALAALDGISADTFVQDVGLALAHEQAGEIDKAIEAYRRLAAQPFSLAGAWAVSRLRYMEAPERQTFPRAAELTALAASINSGLDRMIGNPRSYMSMTVDPVNPNPGPLGNSGYRVTLKNNSAIPLSVGGDRVINTRLLFAPKMEADADRMLAPAVVEVIEVDRRLRLEPGESMSAEVHPEYGWAGYALEAAISRTTRLRWRVLQGFRMTQQGMYEPGPTCLTTETPLVVRGYLPETQLPAAPLCERLRFDAESALPVTVAALRSLFTGPQRGDGSAVFSEDDVAQVAAAAAARYPNLTPLGRTMLLAGLPTSGMAKGLQVFEDSCRTEQDPGVMAVFLATRVREATDPTLVAALSSPDPMLAELARLLTQRLSTNSASYARLQSAPQPVAPQSPPVAPPGTPPSVPR